MLSKLEYSSDSNLWIGGFRNAEVPSGNPADFDYLKSEVHDDGDDTALQNRLVMGMEGKRFAMYYRTVSKWRGLEQGMRAEAARLLIHTTCNRHVQNLGGCFCSHSLFKASPLRYRTIVHGKPLPSSHHQSVLKGGCRRHRHEPLT